MALSDRSRPTSHQAALGRDEAEAVLEARAELGPTYDAALVDSFADRMEQAIEARVQERTWALQRTHQGSDAVGKRQLALGIVSIVGGIPITAINLAVPEDAPTSLVGLVVSWGGIAAVNVAHALAGRRR